MELVTRKNGFYKHFRISNWECDIILHNSVSQLDFVTRQIRTSISVPCVEFMGDKLLSFLVDCNVKDWNLLVKLWGTITNSHSFNWTQCFLSHHYLDPWRYPLRLKIIVHLHNQVLSRFKIGKYNFLEQADTLFN